MSYGPLLVKHGDSCARERHQLKSYQVDEHIRHRAVERLESEPSQVARTSADATEGHLGRALCREARDEAVAQVASAVDVDVAHRVVVGPRKNREEVEVLRGSLHRVVRVLQAAQLHLRLQETVSCLAAPIGATSCPGLASRWILDPASLSQKVTNAPMSFVKARAAVTLCSATPGGTVDCCVCTVG